MIIDTFTFFNELDLLDARLEYLWDTVDYFVLVECNVTHSGKDKPFIFKDNIARFEKYMSKIIYSPYYFHNDSTNIVASNETRWDIEEAQRDHITTALTQFEDSDCVLISDVDDIPSIEAITFVAKELKNHKCISFFQDLYYYNLSTRIDSPWIGTVATNVAYAKSKGAQYFRNIKHVDSIPKINYGGWHLSYFGDIRSIITKISSFAHREYNTFLYNDPYWIMKKIQLKQDLFERDSAIHSSVPLTAFPDKFINCFNKANKDSPFAPFISTPPNNAFEKFSVITPTMWKFDKFTTFLEDLVKLPLVGEIILINNNPECTPDAPILSHPKIKLISFGMNIFVNPAWNLGVEICNYEKVCIMNDDIIFDTKLFNRVYEFLTPGKVVGLCGTEFPQNTNDTGSIMFEHTTQLETHGFGVLMFMCKEDWIPIPRGLLIGFGDYWIEYTMRARYNKLFLIKDLLMYTPHHTTCKTIDQDWSLRLFNSECGIYRKAIDNFKE